MAFIFSVTLFSARFGSGQEISKLRSAKPGSASASVAEPQFPPVEQWEAAINSRNPGILKALYSSNPPAKVVTPAGDSEPDAESTFWTTLSPSKMKVHIVQAQSPQPGVEQVILNVKVLQASKHELTYQEVQVWQEQNQQWKLVASKRGPPTRLEQPVTKKDLYPAGVDAHAEIKEALEKAAHEHKRVIVVFGANWCFDCHVLDLAFHRPDIAPLLNANYEVVHVDIGEGEKNQDLMQQYQVPKDKGIPALAVLESDGRLLYSQKHGEFEKARALGPEDLIEFLKKWKPQGRQAAGG